MLKKKIVIKKSDELVQKKVLDEGNRIFSDLVKRYGFEKARWAFRKALDLNSEKVRLLKRKEQLEKELKDIDQKIK